MCIRTAKKCNRSFWLARRPGAGDNDNSLNESGARGPVLQPVPRPANVLMHLLLMHLLEVNRLRCRPAMACEAFLTLAGNALALPGSAWMNAAIHHEVTEKLLRAEDRDAARAAIRNCN